MHDEPNLAAMDLNLLVTLEALLGERHVTRAAARLGLSQSATSHALARLRRLLGDPLLVRDGQLLVPTTRAAALAPRLAEALASLRSVLAPPAAFDPATARRRFTLGMADYAQFVLLPPLLARLSAAAPHVDLVVRDSAIDRLDEIDFTVAPDSSVARSDPLRGGRQPALRGRRLFRERYVCVARRGHPRIGKKLDLATFVALPHAFIAPRGTPGGVVDDALAERGLTRRVALMIQHFLVAPDAIAGSDLIITLAERLARAFAGRLPLALHEPPLALPRFTMQLYWHERRHLDPAHQWLRRQILEVGAAV
ncbi:MAG: LysR family transcriptional regulator [Myxococcales bacterium]|nr:LysR family transcriptional regulator [Myxococcales bacterium]